MRTAMFCTLCATLATVSLSCNQASAATLTVHTNVPAVKVHVPPPKVNVHPLSSKVQVHNITVTKTASAHQLDKNNGDKGKGGKTKAGMFLKLDGIEGESKDQHHQAE
jgi:hypothetical protein